MIKISCILSPRLYKVYRDGPIDNLYQPQGLEKWGDKIITSANTILNIGLYTSPFIFLYIYKRGLLNFEEARTITRIFGGIGCLMMLSFFMRGFGRSYNPKYLEFLQALTSSTTDRKAYLEALRKYDFEFKSWPITYSLPAKKRVSWLKNHPFSSSANNGLPLYQRMTIQVLAYIATHTFGLRLIYPGSLGLIQNLLWAPLLQGRTTLVENFEGQRAKIGTADGNSIDTMFVENRGSKGKTLVICCEGNSGFYEIGIMTTPIKAGYSALGWNHPGFAGSTGLPYPSQEQNAMDAVMQYAINELGFQPRNIVLFGWSIGGYTASWAAVNYPEVKALILDATFDDLLPLAVNQMPSSWSLLVKEVVRTHVDLNVSELALKYAGPIQLIRRTEDEIICLRQGDLSTNCGNNLVLKLIEARHPELFLEDENNISKALKKYMPLPEIQRSSIERTAISETDRQALKLIGKYMRDYNSTHCSPLPESRFDAIMYSIITDHKG